MRTLMIGGTRYLGRAIVQDLVQHGYEVTALHRGKTLGTLPDRVERLQGDARDRKTLETVLREGRYDLVVDTILNAADLEWCLPMMARYAGQLVHCGSTGVYASADRLPTREDDPTPCSLGFEEKRDQDHALLSFHRKTGFRACSLRVSNVIGPGDVPLDIWGARNVAYFQRLADHKEIWVPNDGRALVQPVHVRDLAWGFRAAAGIKRLRDRSTIFPPRGPSRLTRMRAWRVSCSGRAPSFVTCRSKRYWPPARRMKGAFGLCANTCASIAPRPTRTLGTRRRWTFANRSERHWSG